MTPLPLLLLALSPWGHAATTVESDADEAGARGVRDAAEPEGPDQEQLAEAGAAFARGVQAYNEERYDDAKAEFSRAQQLAPHPDTLFNLGLAQQKTDEHLAAWLSFDELLEQAADEAERDDIIAAQAASRPHVVQLRVLAKTEGAICFDGAPMPRDDEGRHALLTTPGSHRLDVDHERRTLELQGGETRTVELVVAPPAPPPPPYRKLRVLGGLSIGGAVAATGLGLGAGLLESPRSARVGLGVGAAAAGTLALTTSIVALVVHRRAQRWTPPPPRRSCRE